MKKLYFLVGSQDLYGEEALENVKKQTEEMVAFLNEAMQDLLAVELLPAVIDSAQCIQNMQKANVDADCVGVITWMHTFSPAKMWIKGLQKLQKPLLHFHTQAGEKLPYDAIDMDFMNLNQSAHGDREYAFILARMHIAHATVSGYYRHERVIRELRRFAEVALAVDYSRNLNVATFGNNMRQVAVTDGDRVESQIQYGWEVNYYGIGELVERMEDVTADEIDAKIREYADAYEMPEKTPAATEAIREQAKMEVALDHFLEAECIGAFTDNFQDLYQLKQLPGLATQHLMARGIGFGPEGDYKTSAFSAVLMKMAERREGGTGFIEDYTYDLTEGEELELAAHMLEVSPSFAASTPKVEVHPLDIGDKEAPARLVFDGIQGDGIQVTMSDMGDHFRIVCADIELVAQPQEMPHLPVARIMYRHKPNFSEGTAAWLEAGGGHHSVVSTALSREDIVLFARLTRTELVTIGDDGVKTFDFRH
ncbi:MAG: L-arabinose isomerase [Peptoniphilaceae bacterium]|nr:L-arabinose isomerase [Peptoniphilaceae bacterium]MDY6086199.1 L-arabinose isomerase [Peptoniphilaceae bacterium]